MPPILGAVSCKGFQSALTRFKPNLITVAIKVTNIEPGGNEQGRRSSISEFRK